MHDKNNTLLNGLCGDIFNQLIDIFMENKKTEEVKKKLYEIIF